MTADRKGSEMTKQDKRSWALHLEATNEQFATDEIALGPWSSYSMMHDPRHMCFVLSRYKFCAKLLEGKGRVLEVGCGDGFGVPIVAQSVENLHCVDWEERNIQGNRRRLSFLSNVEFECLDLVEEMPRTQYDAAYCIDVVEHLEPGDTSPFLSNITNALSEDGILIIGTPNKTAALHATHRSDVQHINLQTAGSLRQNVEGYFKNCFVFSMNDEVVHTGFHPMAHYLFAMGVGKRSGERRETVDP